MPLAVLVDISVELQVLTLRSRIVDFFSGYPSRVDADELLGRCRSGRRGRSPLRCSLTLLLVYLILRQLILIAVTSFPSANPIPKMTNI